MVLPTHLLLTHACGLNTFSHLNTFVIQARLPLKHAWHLKTRLPLKRVCRSVSKTETEVLSLCGKELSLAGFDDLAREAYFKMDDFANVLALYVKNQVRLKAY